MNLIYFLVLFKRKSNSSLFVIKRDSLNFYDNDFKENDEDESNTNINYAKIEELKFNKSRRNKNMIDYNKLIIKEKEVAQVTEGQCFGETDILTNNVMSSNAFCMETTHLFMIPKDVFINSFAKSISKSEVDRKNFLHSKLPVLKDFSKFEDYYKKIEYMVTMLLKLLFSFLKKMNLFTLKTQKGMLFS